jgi:hypothetical protein
MNYDPLRAIGMIAIEKNGVFSFMGTCFAFRDSSFFITAAHCVEDLNAHYGIAIPRVSIGNDVQRIIRHEKADIAICITDNRWAGTYDPFWNYVSNYGLGEEFMTYGYPVETPYMGQVKPSERLFIGYYQRFFKHSRDKYEYNAGEISITCPAGLSGAPLFRRGAPQMVTGIIAENIEVSTELREEEGLTEGGITEKYIYRKVINYGVAVMLDQYQSWLDENIPKHT